MKFSFVLAFVAIVSLPLAVIAQQTSEVSVTPCNAETSPRPTLRVKQIKADTPTATEQQTFAGPDERPCDNARAESKDVAVQKPATIRFEGLTALTEQDLLRYLRAQRINLSVDLVTDRASVVKAETAIKNVLGDYGHRKAEVTSRLEPRDREPPIVTFVISEGLRFSISQIRFEGNRVFSEQLLALKMKECLAQLDKEAPNVYRSERFEYCLHLLSNSLRSQGYLQARLSEPRVEEVGEALVITVEANEGVLYRLGQLEIEGAYHVALQDIRNLLGMRTGDIANGEKLAKALYEDLRAVYGENGFIKYTAEIQPQFRMDADGGVVDFKITIDEGLRFKLGKISFKGNDLPESHLRQLLLLREGDFFNEKLFAQSVARINDMDWFNQIDKDKDADYRTNEEEGLVNIVIKLTRKDVSRNDQ